MSEQGRRENEKNLEDHSVAANKSETLWGNEKWNLSALNTQYIHTDLSTAI